MMLKDDCGSSRPQWSKRTRIKDSFSLCEISDVRWQRKWRTRASYLALVTRRPYCPGRPKKLCFTTPSLAVKTVGARLGVVKQSFFGLPGQYGRRVTRANGCERSFNASLARILLSHLSVNPFLLFSKPFQAIGANYLDVQNVYIFTPVLCD